MGAGERKMKIFIGKRVKMLILFHFAKRPAHNKIEKKKKKKIKYSLTSPNIHSHTLP